MKINIFLNESIGLLKIDYFLKFMPKCFRNIIHYIPKFFFKDKKKIYICYSFKKYVYFNIKKNNKLITRLITSIKAKLNKKKKVGQAKINK